MQQYLRELKEIYFIESLIQQIKKLKFLRPISRKIYVKFKKQLKTKNNNRESLQIKVTIKPELAVLLDAAIALKNPDLSRSAFCKMCLTKELRTITLGK